MYSIAPRCAENFDGPLVSAAQHAYELECHLKTRLVNYGMVEEDQAAKTPEKIY